MVIRMYESPIHLYMTDIQTQIIKQQEEQILKAVQSVAVGVDHEELFRALKYDRNQYEKGYQDAVHDKDLVEVVRCKDCIHWYEPDGVCLKIYSDGAVSPYAWQYRNEDDFCSYGERKDNET